MPNYPEHWLFSFGGDMLGGKEIWQNNVRFAPTGSDLGPILDEQSVLGELMEDLILHFTSGPSGGGPGYSSSTRLLWGKFNKIAPLGTYADPGVTIRQDLVPPVTTPTAPPTFAPQLALFISFRTAKTRGLAHAGGVYVPMPALTPDSTGQIPPALRDSVALSWSSLITKWNNEPGLDTTTMTAMVVSGTRDGAKEPITQVRVGSVMDTMRSRRNALDETYSTSDVVGQA